MHLISKLDWERLRDVEHNPKLSAWNALGNGAGGQWIDSGTCQVLADGRPFFTLLPMHDCYFAAALCLR